MKRTTVIEKSRGEHFTENKAKEEDAFYTFFLLLKHHNFHYFNTINFTTHLPLRGFIIMYSILYTHFTIYHKTWWRKSTISNKFSSSVSVSSK